MLPCYSVKKDNMSKDNAQTLAGTSVSEDTLKLTLTNQTRHFLRALAKLKSFQLRKEIENFEVRNSIRPGTTPAKPSLGIMSSRARGRPVTK